METTSTTRTCTKAELLEAAGKIRGWTCEKYGSMNPRHVEQYGFPTRLSSDAINCIQNWIDTDTAWCHFQGTSLDFANVTLTVCEKMKKAATATGNDPAKVLVWFTGDPDCVDAKLLSSSYDLFVDDNKEEKQQQQRKSGPEIRVLALVYSLLDQMISALPDHCQNGDLHDAIFDAEVLESIQKIDGTAATAPLALSAVAQLLNILGDGVTVMINAVDHIWTSSDNDGDEDDDDQMPRKSQNILDGLMSALGHNRHRMRLWVSYYNGRGRSVYRETGYSKKHNFRFQSIAGKLIVNLGHPLTELRFPETKRGSWKTKPTGHASTTQRFAL
ncbi:hypothetical protein PFICI_05237 [Pestalotiopsis fici W106-1]|uniref:Uncharacterized protein n=1 Tax=Pestalotiopsis fici (strain W106-1 / CGMCC3.15140) TaxID=1229662 RepID=W3XDU1_PESFW|nr:uncharacterized protein PFICI_05237 [Pestalotiopsis fici W106-1]ETS83361.1 hypothetical protein PFICI_05237 [Pestalotiopsis fici W106-1]